MRTTDLDLRAGESLLAGGERVLDQGALVDVQPATLGCIERAPVCGATGNDPERQLPPLGAQVPKRGIDRSQRKRRDRADGGRMGRKLEFAPDRLDPLSLLADQPWRKMIRQQAHDRRAAGTYSVAVASPSGAVAVGHGYDRRFLRREALDCVGAFDFW